MILVLKFIRTTTPAYISLNKGKYLVGRDKKSDILIEHPTVSRKHCLIEFKKDKWIITDLGSKNGVFINENPVLTSGTLKDGDKLKIGKVNLRVEIYPEEDYLIEKLSKLPVDIKIEAEEETEKIISKTPLEEIELSLLNLMKKLHSLNAYYMERELLQILQKISVNQIGLGRVKDKNSITLISSLSSFSYEELYEKRNPRENFKIQKEEISIYNRYINTVDGIYLLQSTKEIPEKLLELLDLFFRYYFLLLLSPVKTPEQDKNFPLGDYIFESEVIKNVIKQAREIAKREGNILIEGETGAGKEVLAELIHKWSSRKNGPFVIVNSAAIPETLAESELFGVSRKSVTGVDEKAGKFEAANHGTLFFDEIGDMDPRIQAKILRAIETGEICRIGSINPIKVDVRIISATNHDLTSAIENGNFRKDLFFRLASFRIKIPPLRERKEDIVPLAHKFAQEFSHIFSKPYTGITEKAKELLLNYHWPGNIRELKNVIREAILRIGDDGVLSARLLPLSRESMDSLGKTTDLELQSVEREAIIKALKKTGWNKTRAAKLLNISRAGLIKKIQRLGIKKEEIEDG